ncbi:hypothetical protein PR048_006565 [Dryococelus australis]|uniref:Uncharacterized protein n=1 Tax=Dryococelus australis TaxID=614101 RepID=A0ABQ9ICJ3_9NEOP|nr:hypothetical protein PR048_006565 [Dryococelus australis]
MEFVKYRFLEEKKKREGKTKGTERKPFKRNETPGGQRAHQADISFTAFSCKVMSKDNIFILDSGATNHLFMGSLEEYMSYIRMLPHRVVIKTANGGEIIATRTGKFMGDYGSETISFEALIVPGLKNNLLSVRKLIQKNLIVFFSKEKVTIKGKNVSVECEKEISICSYYYKILRLGHLNRRGLQVLNLPFSEEKCPQSLEESPASVWFGENYLSKLRVFGSQAYMLKLPRESKLEPRANSMIMVGYSGGGYRLRDPLKDKIVSWRDITFNESKVGVGNDTARSEVKTDIEENKTKEVAKHGTPQQPSEESDEEFIGFESPDKEKNKRSKPNRTIKKPSHLQEYELYMNMCWRTTRL